MDTTTTNGHGTQATTVQRWRVPAADGTYPVATVEREAATITLRTRLSGELSLAEAAQVAAALFTAAGLTDEDVERRTAALASAARDVADGLKVLAAVIGGGALVREAAALEPATIADRLGALEVVLRGALT